MTPFVAVLVAALAPADPAAARFVVKGAVVDPTGAPIAGAQATALSSDQRTPPTAQSGANGEFSLALVPGSYSIRVSAAGFLESVYEVTATAEGQDAHEFVREGGAFRGDGHRGPRRLSGRTITSATRTPTPLRDVPQSVTVVTRELIRDQLMLSIGDVMRYVPGIRSTRARTTATRSSSAATARRPTSSSTACATTCSTTATSTTSSGSRRSRARTR